MSGFPDVSGLSTATLSDALDKLGIAGHAEAAAARLDAVALANDAQLVERVAQRRGVELGSPFDVAVGFHGDHPFSMCS